MTDGPLIVQSDKTVLLEVDHELAGAARAAIAPFAELERAPEHIHTYRITPLALWNARAAGHDAEQLRERFAPSEQVEAYRQHEKEGVPVRVGKGRAHPALQPACGGKRWAPAHGEPVEDEVVMPVRVAASSAGETVIVVPTTETTVNTDGSKVSAATFMRRSRALSSTLNVDAPPSAAPASGLV